MEIRELKKEEFEEFKSGIQGAFQKGYEDYYGKCEKVVIPDKDIVESYTAEGSYSFVAVENDEIIGGATPRLQATIARVLLLANISFPIE